MIRFLLLIAMSFALANSFSFGQKTIINVAISGSPKNTIKYSNYIHENYFMSLTNYEGNITKQIDSTYSIELDLKSEIFFGIRINNLIGVPIALAPADTVNIDVLFKKDSLKKGGDKLTYLLKISKSNHIAHTIYRQRFNPIAKHFAAIDSLTDQLVEERLFEVYDKAKYVINKKLKVWDSLLNEKSVSFPVYNLYVQDIKGSLYKQLVLNLLKAKSKKNDSSFNSMRDSLIQIIFKEQGADNSYLLKTLVGSRFHEMYLSRKVRQSALIQDTLLKQIYESYFYLFDTAYREKAWGNSVLLPAFVSPYNENIAEKWNMMVFSKYYPNSVYLKKMRAIYDSVRLERQSKSTFQEIDPKSYKSLLDIFNQHSNRFYFVDVWATWCAPCIGEFAYTARLEHQLDSLNVKKIYLSIDETSDSTKWKNLIKKYYLNGSHYLVGRDIQIEIIKRLLNKDEVGVLSIPQYFIYDKLNDKYYMNLSRPSSENILYEEIKKIITN
ncbi:MAG: TlpA family protein disulfide reductase [Chitinophagaceae bacterium]